MAQLNQTVRELALASLREWYPTASPVEFHRRLADIVLGTELAEKAYGPLLATPATQFDLDEIVLKVEAESIARLLEAQ